MKKNIKHKMECGFGCKFIVRGGSEEDAWKQLDAHNKKKHSLTTVFKIRL